MLLEYLGFLVAGGNTLPTLTAILARFPHIVSSSKSNSFTYIHRESDGNSFRRIPEIYLIADLEPRSALCIYEHS